MHHSFFFLPLLLLLFKYRNWIKNSLKLRVCLLFDTNGKIVNDLIRHYVPGTGGDRQQWMKLMNRQCYVCVWFNNQWEWRLTTGVGWTARLAGRTTQVTFNRNGSRLEPRGHDTVSVSQYRLLLQGPQRPSVCFIIIQFSVLCGCDRQTDRSRDSGVLSWIF
jgi:hypothetical protein